MDDSYVFSNTSSSSSSTRPARSANAHGNTYKEFSLRKGKWTAEEEAYSNKIISLFNKGLLPIAAGTTLRSFLSDKLQCDPMRITKKYSGASCIGKQIFQVTLKILIKMVFESSNLFYSYSYQMLIFSHLVYKIFKRYAIAKYHVQFNFLF